MEITIPGALADFLAGTNLVSGADDRCPLSKATREALEAGRHGRGSTLIITPSLDVLRVIGEYAETLLDMSDEEISRSERDAARLWVKRATDARTKLRAAAAKPAPAPAAPIGIQDTYAIEGTATTKTGHYQLTTGRATYCNKTPGTPTTGIAIRICKLCAAGRERELARIAAIEAAKLAEQTAPQLTIPAADEPMTMRCVIHRADCDNDPTRRHEFRPAAPDDAAKRAELADTLAAVSEAETTDGTWRGQWIGTTATAADALFNLPTGADQGALFN